MALLWADGAVHTCRHSKKYLNLLDLDSGRALHSECVRIWPHYGEVIKNRKKCIMDLVVHHTMGEKITQLAIFGSGMDALSLETVSRTGGVAAYEVDYSRMSLKEGLIRKACGTGIPIRCISSDLNDAKKVLGCMRKRGWNSSMPSVLVLEGISYFLGRKSLWDLIAAFRTADRRNVLLLEYLIPKENIAKSRQGIPERVFGAIQRNSGSEVRRTARYDIGEMGARLGKIGGKIIRRYSMKDMEKNRTGRNVYFKTCKSGWIEVCQASI